MTNNAEQRLLDSALELFVAYGFHAVSVRNIAREAGVTTPTLYYYFSDKRSLYFRLLYDFVEEREAIMRQAYEKERDPLKRIVDVLTVYGQNSTRDEKRKSTYLLWFKEGIGGGNVFPELVAKYESSIREMIRESLTEAMRAGTLRRANAHHASVAIIGIMSAFIRRSDPLAPGRRERGGRVNWEDGIKQVCDVFFEGLRRAPKGEATAPVAAEEGAE